MDSDNMLPSSRSESLISNIPALQLFRAMGWAYLAPDEALAEVSLRCVAVEVQGTGAILNSTHRYD